jgi:hypothetical protein
VLDSALGHGHIHVMSTMIVEVYEAFKAAGAPEDKAQAAAKALANRDDRFDRVDVKLAALEVKLAPVEAELGMVKSIVSGIGFGVVLLILRSFWPGA